MIHEVCDTDPVHATSLLRAWAAAAALLSAVLLTPLLGRVAVSWLSSLHGHAFLRLKLDLPTSNVCVSAPCLFCHKDRPCVSGQGCCCTNALQHPRAKRTVHAGFTAVPTVQRHRPLNKQQTEANLNTQTTAAQPLLSCTGCTADQTYCRTTLYISSSVKATAQHHTYNLLLSLFFLLPDAYCTPHPTTTPAPKLCAVFYQKQQAKA